MVARHFLCTPEALLLPISPVHTTVTMPTQYPLLPMILSVFVCRGIFFFFFFGTKLHFYMFLRFEQKAHFLNVSDANFETTQGPELTSLSQISFICGFILFKIKTGVFSPELLLAVYLNIHFSF